MENVVYTGINYVKQRLYPFTWEHLIYIGLFTAITTYISEYILRFKLLKWIYLGTMLVIVANLYNQGDDTKAIDKILKWSIFRNGTR